MPQSQMKGPTDTRWSTCKGTAVPRHPQESGQVRPVSPRLAARRGHAPVPYLKATRDRPKPHGLISSATGTAAHGSGPPTPPNSRHSSRRPARTRPNGPAQDSLLRCHPHAQGRQGHQGHRRDDRPHQHQGGRHLHHHRQRAAGRRGQSHPRRPAAAYVAPTRRLRTDRRADC